jgi:hypothetical protein
MLNITNTLALFSSDLADLEHQVSSLSVRSVLLGSAAVLVLVLIGALVRNRLPRLKLPIFASITVLTLVVTTILISSTIFLNTNSSSKGPVHWHADFEIWACGEPYAATVSHPIKGDRLRDPTGFLSNKIGTTTYHEHNDFRIHLEGVVVTPGDASLGKFFRVIGGEITNRSLLIPLDDNQTAYFENSEVCPEGTPQASQAGQVQVYAYRALDQESSSGKSQYRQEKVSDPANFIINDHPNVPPGDCIIIEFGPLAERTEHKCHQYKVQDDTLHKWEEVR